MCIRKFHELNDEDSPQIFQMDNAEDTQKQK